MTVEPVINNYVVIVKKPLNAMPIVKPMNISNYSQPDIYINALQIVRERDAALAAKGASK